MTGTTALNDVKKIKIAFGNRQGRIFFDSPSQEKYLPTWAAETGNIICDAAYQIKKNARGFASSVIYFPIIIPPEATFFVYYSDETYYVVCSLDCDIDRLIAAIASALSMSTPN